MSTAPARRLLAVLLLLTGLLLPAGAAMASTTATVSPLAPGARPAPAAPAVAPAPASTQPTSPPGAPGQPTTPGAAPGSRPAPTASTAAPTSGPAADAAVADATTPTGNDDASGRDLGVLSGLDAEDTHGLSVGKYQLSVDGGGPTNPIKFVTNGFLLSLTWEAYRWLAGLAVTLINMALQMSWLDALSKAIEPVATTLQVNVIDRLGLSQIALALTGLVAGGMIAKGKIASGFGRLLFAAVVAGAAATILANPVGSITGDDGLLQNAKKFGQSTATIVVSGGTSSQADPAAIEEETSAALVDTFVRLPHQLLNYGAIIDGGGCESAYDNVLKKGPYASDDDAARSAVGDCQEKLKNYADDPGWTGVISSLVLLPAGILLLVLSLVLVVIAFLASILVLFCALKLIWDLITAQAPGERAGLASSLASIVGALVLMVSTHVLLAVYCVLLKKVMIGDDGQDVLSRFLVIDLLLIVLIIITIATRKRIAERGRRWAERASSWAGAKGGAPVQMPRLSNLSQAGATIAANRATLRRATSGGTGAVHGNTAQRLGQRIAQSKVVRTGVAAATVAGGVGGFALKSTIGAPVYAPRAARAASAAVKMRSAAMRTGLQNAKARAGGFATEYAHNVGVVTNPVTKPVARAGAAVGKAAGRKAAPTVTATGVRIGSMFPGSAQDSTAESVAQHARRKAPVAATSRTRRDGSAPAAASQAAQRQAARRQQRSEDPTRLTSTGSAGAPSYRVSPRPAAQEDAPAATTRWPKTPAEQESVSRLYERLRLRDGAARAREER
jgi:hypothetical protein